MVNKIEKLQKYIEQSNFKEALNTVNKILKRDKNPSLLNVKGVILLQDGKVNYAIEIFLEVINLEPNFADALNNLGMAYQKKGAYEKAAKYLLQAISLRKDYIEARHNLAIVYESLDEPYKVIEELKLLLQLEPKHIPSLRLLGDVYLRVNNLKEAKAAHEEALKNELSPINLYKLGMDYMFEGNQERGVDCLKPTLPFYLQSFYTLVTHTNYEFSKSDLDYLIKAFNFEKDIANQSLAGFTYARILKKKKEYEKSFEVLMRANELKKSIVSFNQESFMESIKNIQNYFLDIQEIQMEFPQSDLRPIFILGAPRSGTTIVEQTLSNHSLIFGAGEVSKLDKLFDKLISKKDISLKSIQKLRDDYFLFIKKMTNKKYFIDKTPFNSFYIGLIKKVFPESIIINTIRDFKLVAFSMYEINFDHLPYTNCQEDIVFYLKNYKKNMQFWGKYKFDNFLLIDLEKFNQDREHETRKIFSLLKLDFDKKYLDVANNLRPVYTASSSQVRSKNISPSEYSAKNYGKILERFSSMIEDI